MKDIPVNDWVEHGVNDGQHLGHTGEVILQGAELILQGRHPLHDVQQKPSKKILRLGNELYESQTLFGPFKSKLMNMDIS